MITNEEKDEVVELAKELFENITKSKFSRKMPSKSTASGACLYWTYAVVGAARLHGIKLVVQAGSAFWEITPEGEDDGVSNTHFGYKWTGEMPSDSLIKTANDLGFAPLPEVHIWAVEVESMQIVDLTVSEQPITCEAMGIGKWATPPPPEYLWHDSANLPCGLYSVERTPTLLFGSMIDRMMKNDSYDYKT